jgi:hypothetical protein
MYDQIAQYYYSIPLFVITPIGGGLAQKEVKSMHLRQLGCLPARLAGGGSPTIARISSRALFLYIVAIKDSLSTVATHGHLY